MSILVASMAIYFLWDLFAEKGKIINYEDIFYRIKNQWFTLFLVFLLMPVNWVTETFKWRMLIRRLQGISFFLAIQSILLGVLLSILSPNRIGELGGRLVFIKKNNLLSAFYFNLLCSFSQLLVTIISGLTVLLFFDYWLSFYFSGSLSFVKFTAVCVILGAFIIYFSSDRMRKILFYFNQKFQLSSKNIQQTVSKSIRLKLLALSFFRYLVFSLQFYLLLRIFNVDINISNAFAGIALVFFSAAVIPTAWISDLPVRSSIAYMIFETGFNFGMEALFSSLLLWMINLLIPACLGLLILPKVNWIYLKKLKF